MKGQLLSWSADSIKTHMALRTQYCLDVYMGLQEAPGHLEITATFSWIASEEAARFGGGEVAERMKTLEQGGRWEKAQYTLVYTSLTGKHSSRAALVRSPQPSPLSCYCC